MDNGKVAGASETLDQKRARIMAMQVDSPIRFAFEERAAIVEYDGKMTRAFAEARALAECEG